MSDGREVVVVTGSSGFIGSAVIENLAKLPHRDGKQRDQDRKDSGGNQPGDIST